MPRYVCQLCNFSSKIKTHFRRHLNTAKHKKALIADEAMTQNDPQMTQNDPQMTQNDPVKKKYKCHHCGELFSTIPHKRRHELHRCKKSPYVKENVSKELKNKVAILKKEKQIQSKTIKQLEKKVDNLTDKIGDTTNIQNNNIVINSYGKEDVSYITDAFKTELLKIPYGAIPEMFKEIHFNDSKPENMNIMYPNINKNILKIKNENGWSHKNKDLILYDMIDSKYLMLDDHFTLVVNGEKLSNHNKSNYVKFRDKYDNGDKGLLNELKDECTLVMLDNRENIVV